MPRAATTRQQQAQERIILSQAPQWLSSPDRTAAAAANHESPGDAVVAPVSLIRRLAAAATASLTTAPSQRQQPGAAVPSVVGAAADSAGASPIGTRVSASSPFPTRAVNAASAAQAPPNLVLGHRNDAGVGGGSRTPEPRRVVGFRGVVPDSTGLSSTPPPSAAWLACNSSDRVVHGAPPSMQGLGAILAGTGGRKPTAAKSVAAIASTAPGSRGRATQLAPLFGGGAPASRQQSRQAQQQRHVSSRQGYDVPQFDGVTSFEASYAFQRLSTAAGARSSNLDSAQQQGHRSSGDQQHDTAAAASTTHGVGLGVSSSFWVPDLSDMDPFTLMERGLVQELSLFRNDPQGYFETVVLPDVALELPTPPAGTDAGGSLHVALVPKCIVRLTAHAKELRRREAQRQQELRQILEREASFHATHPDMVVLGGVHLGKTISAQRQPNATTSNGMIVVLLLAAEVYVDELGQAISDIKRGATTLDDGDAAQGGKGAQSKKTATAKAAAAAAAAAEAHAASNSDTKPTPAQRRAAVETLQAHLNQCIHHLAARQESVEVLRNFNEWQAESRAHNVDPQSSKAQPTAAAATPLLSPMQLRRQRTPSPTGGQHSAHATPPSSSPVPKTEDDAADEPCGLPKISYIKGLCMASRDLAELLSNSAANLQQIAAQQQQASQNGPIVDDATQPLRALQAKPATLTTVEKLASQYGKVTEGITAYVVYGLWHRPQTAVASLVLSWLAEACPTHPSQVPTASRAPMLIGPSSDATLLYGTQLSGGAGWQRHATHGAVTVVLLSSGFQEISYIKQHRNLPVIELRRCFNLGQMGREERVYDLTFIPEHYEIRAVKPLVHPLVCGRRVEVVVSLPKNVLLCCVIESGTSSAQPARSLATTFVDRVGKYAKLQAVLMEAAPAKLVVFARHPGELQYRRASTVLLKPSPILWDAAPAPATSPIDGDEMATLVATPSPNTRVAPNGGGGDALSPGDDVAGLTGAPSQLAATAVFPEQFEFFQIRHGLLLCPRHGELTDAATLASESPDPAAAIAFLPPGTSIGPPTQSALAAGGTLFSFRCSADSLEATVTGAHGISTLHRLPCWAAGIKAETRPRHVPGAPAVEPPNLAWFFGVVKIKVGPPVTLWVDGQCALQWSVSEPV